jgi:phospholipid/cholesterol/gamma-HCH transport system substrate-binding protein
MESKTLEVKVGIFVFVALIIMFIIVFSISDFYVFGKAYRIDVEFSFANGMAESAPVRLAGVDVGTVDKIDVFYDEEAKKTKVILHVRIIKPVKIEKNAVARINTLGLLGEKYLEITPGTATAGFLTDGATLRGDDPILVEALTKDMKYLVDSVTEVVDRLKRGEGTVGKLLVEEKIYHDLEAFVEDIKRNPWKLLHKPKGRRSQEEKEERKSRSNISPR